MLVCQNLSNDFTITFSFSHYLSNYEFLEFLKIVMQKCLIPLSYSVVICNSQNVMLMRNTISFALWIQDTFFFTYLAVQKLHKIIVKLLDNSNCNLDNAFHFSSNTYLHLDYQNKQLENTNFNVHFKWQCCQLLNKLSTYLKI